jgi:Zn finger protein HypA/HybF involved in hydrogenase expression
MQDVTKQKERRAATSTIAAATTTRVECHRCSYVWNSKSTLLHVTCPNCRLTVKRITGREYEIARSTYIRRAVESYLAQRSGEGGKREV